jgi:threonine/homoserine efflux transporter RhtA
VPKVMGHYPFVTDIHRSAFASETNGALLAHFPLSALLIGSVHLTQKLVSTHGAMLNKVVPASLRTTSAMRSSSTSRKLDVPRSTGFTSADAQ